MNAAEPMEILNWQQPDRALTLVVDSYQFPGNTNNNYDNQWLMISGAVRCPLGAWAFREPCLMSSELLELAARLESGYGPDSPGFAITIEPVLDIAWIAAGQVRVVFRLEAAPSWDYSELAESDADGWGFPLFFDVTAALAGATAQALREAAARFPPQ